MSERTMETAKPVPAVHEVADVRLPQTPERVLGRGSALARTAVLALQEGAGNVAVGRLLARERSRRRERRLARAAEQYKPWEVPGKGAEWYPGREVMTKKIARVLRMFELLDASPELRAKAYEAVLERVEAELPGLEEAEKQADAKAKELGRKRPKPDAETVARRKRIAQLKAAIRAAKGTPERIAEVTAELESESLAADKVGAEFERLLNSSVTPEWLRAPARFYAGIRYVTGKGAHGTWHSARNLLYALEVQRVGAASTKKKKVKPDPDVVKSLKAMSEEDALQKLRDMRTAGDIPDGAWGQIVDNTSLRLDKKPPEAGAPTATAVSQESWAKVIARWLKGTDAVDREGGSRSWLTVLNQRKGLVATSVVCNQITEAIGRERGIKGWPSGIGYDAKFVAKAVAAGANTPPTATADGKVPVAGYFRQAASPEDFRPGAMLFFISGRWGESASKHADVYYAPPLKYPIPNDPLPPKTKKLDSDREKWWEDLIPDGREKDGWKYDLQPNDAITREKDGVTHYLRFSHMATVVRRIGSTVHTFETTGAATGAGMSQRSVASLSDASVIVGYLPGDYPEYIEPAPLQSLPPSTEPGPTSE